MALREVRLTDLEIRDERTFRAIPVVGRLKERLIADGYRFFVAADPGETEDWARVLFLNLTYWGASGAAADAGPGGDVLAEDAIDADVVAHVGWHHVVAATLRAEGASPSTDAQFFGEAVASAFDLYLLGSVFGRVKHSSFLDSAVPAMTEVLLNAGLDDDDVARFFEEVGADPVAAFEGLRALLFDVCAALLPCRSVAEAAAVLDGVRDHRFGPLLHHFELSNWVLHARLYGGAQGADPAVRAWDAALRSAPNSLEALTARCLGS